MAKWFTFDADDTEALDRLVLAWSEAPVENPEVCEMLLEVAREQVIAYAPAPGTAASEVAVLLERFGLQHHLDAVLLVLELDTLEDPPLRYVYAQLQQATNLWNAGRVASDGSLGDGQFVFTPRPLDKTVRAIIRPLDGKPHVL